MFFAQCLIEAVMANGLRGLAQMVPGGGFAFDVGKYIIDKYRQKKELEQAKAEVKADVQESLKKESDNVKSEIKADLEQFLQADVDKLRKELSRIAHIVAAGRPEAEIRRLEAYAMQAQAVARQSLKRVDDPSGRSVPKGFDPQNPASMAALLPDRLPRFCPGDPVPNAPQWQFVALLGSGGFGEVWLAKHNFLDQRRAFKFCLDPQARERLLRHEANVVRHVMQATAQMQGDDPDIVRLLEIYLEGETPWLAYEYIEGSDLAAIVHALKNRSPAERSQHALRWLMRIAELVGRFHRLATPIIHRDLKPANILLQKGAKGWRPRITDFGISHVSANRNVTQLAHRVSSLTLGASWRGAHTPIYASPQQKRGEPADPREDVYALGIIGYQMLIGDVWADRPGGRSWRQKLVDCQMPAGVLDVLESCWDDAPDERPKDGAELAERLHHAQLPPPVVPIAQLAPQPLILPTQKPAGRTQAAPPPPFIPAAGTRIAAPLPVAWGRIARPLLITAAIVALPVFCVALCCVGPFFSAPNKRDVPGQPALIDKVKKEVPAQPTSIAEKKQLEDRKSADAYAKRGTDMYYQGNLNKAIADYTEAIRLDPKNSSYLAARARAWELKKDYDKAIADYTEAIRRYPKNNFSFEDRARAWIAKKDYDKAIADYTEVIPLSSIYSWNVANRGYASYISKKGG